MKTRELILKTAYELFQEKSYNEVSVNDICGKCSLTKPAFYYHFSSKADLLLNYYDDVIAHIFKKITNMDGKDNYWEQYIFCFSELVTAGINLGADLTSQLYITNLTEDKGSFDFNESFCKLCVELIEQGQAAGQIGNRQKPQDLFIASSFMFTGFEVMWGIKKGRFDRVSNVVLALEAVFDVAPEYRVKDVPVTLEFENFE